MCLIDHLLIVIGNNISILQLATFDIQSTELADLELPSMIPDPEFLYMALRAKVETAPKKATDY